MTIPQYLDQKYNTIILPCDIFMVGGGGAYIFSSYTSENPVSSVALDCSILFHPPSMTKTIVDESMIFNHSDSIPPFVHHVPTPHILYHKALI